MHTAPDVMMVLKQLFGCQERQPVYEIMSLTIPKIVHFWMMWPSMQLKPSQGKHEMHCAQALFGNMWGHSHKFSVQEISK